jgi:hypothetical protein
VGARRTFCATAAARPYRSRRPPAPPPARPRPRPSSAVAGPRGALLAVSPTPPPPHPPTPPGSLATAAATANTVNDATTDNDGGNTPLLGDPDPTSQEASTDAAILSFTLTPKVNGKLV